MCGKFLMTVFILFVKLTAYPIENLNPPILVLATNTGFGTYSGEILKAEGFNEFQTDSLSDKKVTLSYLQEFDVIILGKTSVTETQKKMLSEYVKSGGNLIAFVPDKQLNSLLGIKEISGTITEGYLGLEPNTEHGKGISSKKMQFHGIAGKYSLNGGKAIAKLYADKFSLDGFPGVVSNNYGKGQSVTFLYNLPLSIVYTRQGNPQLAGIEKDGILGLRAMDLFADGWVDQTNNAFNQADEQMMLLAHCIEAMNKNYKPLPRFWYFPDTLKCLVTLTNDGEYKAEADFEKQFADVDSMKAKMTLYVLETQKVSKEWVSKWTSKGFEISGHPDDTKEAIDPKWDNMNLALSTKKNELRNLFGIPMKTVVNHWFVWCGNDSEGKTEFAAQAVIETKQGLKMDANYAHYDNTSRQGHFLGSLGTNQGNFNGSGLLMKFANSEGKILDIYQLLTNVYDQQYTENHDEDDFFNCFKGLMDRSLENEVYSFISIKAHNDEYYFSKKPLMKMLEYANSKHVPVWTAANLADFMLAKDEASFSTIVWSGNQLRFKLTSSVRNDNGLSVMLLAGHGKVKINNIVVNGKNRPIDLKSVKGFEYAFVTIQPGSNYDFFVNYK